MRNLYFTDIKRILKDKLFMVTCILAAAFAVINPLLNKVVFEMVDMGDMLGVVMNAKSMMFSAFHPGDNLGLILPILMAIIVSKDFSQGTVRNKIISGKKRSSIFLSHLFSSATVICAIMLVHAILTLGVSLFFFSYQDAAFSFADFGYLVISVLFEMLVYAAIAAIVTLIATVSKNMGICILLYLAVSFGLSLIGAIFQVAGSFMDTSTVAYNIVEFFGAINIYSSSLIGAGVSYSLKHVVYILIAPTAIIAGCTLLGIKMFGRKNLK